MKAFFRFTTTLRPYEATSEAPKFPMKKSIEDIYRDLGLSGIASEEARQIAIAHRLLPDLKKVLAAQFEKDFTRWVLCVDDGAYKFNPVYQASARYVRAQQEIKDHDPLTPEQARAIDEMAKRLAREEALSIPGVRAHINKVYWGFAKEATKRVLAQKMPERRDGLHQLIAAMKIPNTEDMAPPASFSDAPAWTRFVDWLAKVSPLDFS